MMNDAECDNVTDNKCKFDEKSASLALQGIKDPHDNDVLYGKYDGNNQHSGNQRYTKMIENRRVEYHNSDRLSKPLVALDIVREWREQDPPGRFLKQDKEGLWNDVGDKKAREKISQALRKKSTIVNNNSSILNSEGNNDCVNNDSKGDNGVNNESEGDSRAADSTRNNVNNSNSQSSNNARNTKKKSTETAPAAATDSCGISRNNENKLFTDRWLDRLTEKLYARKEEKRMLFDAYHRCLAMNHKNYYHSNAFSKNDKDKSNEEEQKIDMILISGQRGTGKTKIAKSLEKTVVHDDGGYLVTCNFRQQFQQQPGHRPLEQDQQQQQRQKKQQPQHYHQSPCTALAEGIADFIHNILQRGGQVVHDIRSNIYKEFNVHNMHNDFNNSNNQHFQSKQQEWNVLLKMIPPLNLLLHDGDIQFAYPKVNQVKRTTSTLLVDHDMIIQTNEVSNHFARAMEMLMRIISSSLQKPILLLYDDIHFADTSSLSFMRSLQKHKIENLVIVATATCTCASCTTSNNTPSSPSCTTNISSDSCRVLGIFRTITSADYSDDIKICKVNLRRLSGHFVENTICKAMQIKTTATTGLYYSSSSAPKQSTTKATSHDGCDVNKKLAGLIWSYTKGNVFYIVELLKFLIGEDLLQYDIENGAWKCAEREILPLLKLLSNASCDDDNHDRLADLFLYKLQKLSPNVKTLLKVASCLCHGSHHACSSTPANTNTAPTKVQTQLLNLLLPFPIQPLLDGLVANGLLTYDNKHEMYNFRHDAIQQAAYSLITFDSQCYHEFQDEREEAHAEKFTQVSKASSGSSSNTSNTIDSRTDSSTDSYKNSLYCNKESFHLVVGRDLWKALVIDNEINVDDKNYNISNSNNSGNTESNSKNSLLEEYIFTLLSQYESGLSFVKTKIERYAIAALCLHGAKLAANTSNFAISLHYLNFAIDFLLVDTIDCSSSVRSIKNSGNSAKDIYDTNTKKEYDLSFEEQPMTMRSIFSKKNKNKKQQRSSCWRDRYDLTLAIYNAAAEMELVHGNIENAERYVQEVLHNARNDRDKIQAYCSQIYVLGVIDQQQQALDVGIRVLKMLGETFPTRQGILLFKHEMDNVKKLIKKITGSCYIRNSEELPSKLLRRLEFMVMDDDKLRCMQILKLLMLQSIFVRPKLALFVVLKLMKLTLLHGLSIYSSIAFSSYGAMCVIIGDIEEGYRFGRLAIELLDKFQVKNYLPRVYITCFGGIFCWKRPLHDSVKSFLIGYSVGLQIGDVESAMINAHKYSEFMFEMGTTKLDDLASQIRQSWKTVEAYTVTTPVLLIMQPLLQAIYNLSGKRKWAESIHANRRNTDVDEFTSSSHETKGEGMCDQNFVNTDTNDRKNDDVRDNFETTLQYAKETKHPLNLLLVHVFSMVTAYYFHDYNYALKMSTELRKGPRIAARNPPGIAATIGLFYATLTHLAVAREYKRTKKYFLYKRFMRIVKQLSIKKFVEWSARCPENFAHKLCLLQAEYASVVAYLSRKEKVQYAYNNSAYEKYFTANAVAQSSDNFSAQALINERAGYHYYYNKSSYATTTSNTPARVTLNDDGTSALAMKHFRTAIACYEKWGAHAKVQHLQEQIKSMFGKTPVAIDLPPSPTAYNDARAEQG